MTLNPFDLTGGPFLALYIGLLLVAIAASMVIPRRMRPEGRRRDVTNPDALAILSGGRVRFADGVMTRLLTRGSLIMMGKNAFGAKPGARGETAAEMSILSLSSPIPWSTILKRLPGYAEPVERKLVTDGLWIDDTEKARIRFWQTLPYVLLIGFGAIKLMVGEARHKPVGFLTALLILTVVLAAIRWFTVDRKTRTACHALENARLQHQRLKIAPTADEAALGVALFGTTVLAGSSFADYHRLRAASDGSGGGGDSSSSDGGGGCGGGGCGGCGGS